MVTEEAAAELRRLCLRAIEALSESLVISRAGLSDDEYEARRRATGSIIGRIQMELLEPLNACYPHLDDLQNSTTSE
jgi:hypothetical protein